jgi:Na+-transporting NADH:ubiquinone oxidoreductase subunit NqrD
MPTWPAIARTVPDFMLLACQHVCTLLETQGVRACAVKLYTYLVGFFSKECLNRAPQIAFLICSVVLVTSLVAVVSFLFPM